MFHRATRPVFSRRPALPLLATSLVASVAAILAAGPAGAQESEAAADERLAELQERVEAVRERLGLDDEQVEQLKPILLENFESTRAVLQEHGFSAENRAEGGSNRRPNLRQLRSLGRDLDGVREAMFDEIEKLGFLTDDQFDEFKKIQEELRAALRERLRAGRVFSR